MFSSRGFGWNEKLIKDCRYDNARVWMVIAAAAIVALAHTAPAPFLFDWLAGWRVGWHMP
jgi:hypothetical protein